MTILISSCHDERILFLFTYAKIEYVSVRTYLSKIEYVAYATHPRVLHVN